MLVIDSGEPKSVIEAFEEKGIPYIQTEIRFFCCKSCGAVYTKPIKKCIKTDLCGEDGSIISDRVADFTNTNRTFIVERKTEADFIASTLDYSLHDQARRMAMYFQGQKFVFLEGFISVLVDDPHNRKIKPWLRSMRVTLSQFDVYLWQMDDIYMLIDELVRLDEKCGEQPRIHEKIDDKYTGWSDQKKIVCKLLDVSDKKADKLLEIFGSPWDIFSAILKSNVIYTRTGNPKGVTGPFESIKGFSHKFILKNKKMLLNEG